MHKKGDNILFSLLAVYIVFSCITRTIGDTGVGITGRLVFSDTVALIMVLNYFCFRGYIRKSWVMLGAVVFLLSLVPGLFVTNSLEYTIIELLIYLFLLTITLCVSSLIYSTSQLRFYLIAIILTSLFASLIGIWDTIAGITPLPRLFKPRYMTESFEGLVGESLGGFRNAGQAGSYMFMMLSILIPLRFSRMALLINSNFGLSILNISLSISTIYLFMTGKVAAIIGFAISVACYVLFVRNSKFLMFFCCVCIVAIFAWPMVVDIAPEFSDRLIYKFESRVLYLFDAPLEKKSGFFDENYGKALSAFRLYPLLGTGIGAFALKMGGGYEVHSTYLKILGEAGFFGMIGYSLFMITILYTLIKNSNIVQRRKTIFSDYLLHSIPFLIGNLVSWSYTYHIRKREFWLFVILILVVVKFHKRAMKIPTRQIFSKNE